MSQGQMSLQRMRRVSTAGVWGGRPRSPEKRVDDNTSSLLSDVSDARLDEYFLCADGEGLADLLESSECHVPCEYRHDRSHRPVYC